MVESKQRVIIYSGCTNPKGQEHFKKHGGPGGEIRVCESMKLAGQSSVIPAVNHDDLVVSPSAQQWCARAGVWPEHAQVYPQAWQPARRVR